MSPGISAGYSLTGASNAYSTGDTQSWIEADFGMWGTLSRSIDWNWTVGDRNGSGVTPLKFDGNSADAWTSSVLTFHLSPTWAMSIRGTYNFYSSTMSSVQLEIRTTAFGDRSMALTFDATGGTVTGIYDMPHMGNIGVQYDQTRSVVYLFFQPH
jgi:hypothetical protein